MKKVRILSIDGGGFRGIIPAYTIKYIEEYLRKKKPETTIADHFDLIAGTSTGGLLAALYMMPDGANTQSSKYTAEAALNFYLEKGNKIFNQSKISGWKRLWGLYRGTVYRDKYWSQYLEQELGNTKFSSLRKPCFITAYDMKSRTSIFFNSADDPQKKDYYVKDIVKATTAAPTYFPPALFENVVGPNTSKRQYVAVDGGVFANNPVMCAYVEARNMNFVERNVSEPTAKDMQILSLGTGGGGYRMPNLAKSAQWSLLKWGRLIPQIMIDGGADVAAYQMKEIFRGLEPTQRENYLRVDTPWKNRTYTADMADASDKNMEELCKAAKMTLAHAKRKGLDEFLDKLLK